MSVHLQGVDRLFEWDPEPRCVNPKNRRRRFWPAQRLLYSSEDQLHLPAAFKEDDARIRELVSEPLAALAERFEACQWRFLEALGTLPEALELAQDNPVLAYTIANNSEMARRSPASGSFLAIRYFRGARRKACAWLGFPDRQATVNVFKHIDPCAAHPSNLRMLRMRLQDDPSLLPQLNHLPCLSTGVMSLIVMPEWKELGSPRLLKEVASAPEENNRPLTANLLQDYLSMMRQSGNAMTLFPIASLKRLHELHEKEHKQYQQHLVAEQKEQERLQRLAYQREYRLQEIQQGQELPPHNSFAPAAGRPFPLPPIPGTKTIIPITTPEALKEESRVMSNCVATYESRIRNGLTYIYQVLEPQRGTLHIACRSDGLWVRRELKKQHNRLPTISQTRAVDTWLWESIEERNRPT